MRLSKTTPNTKTAPNTKARRRFRTGVKAGGAAMWNTNSWHGLFFDGQQ